MAYQLVIIVFPLRIGT